MYLNGVNGGGEEKERILANCSIALFDKVLTDEG